MEPEAILHQHFGYSQFRDGQKEIITSLINRKDTLAIMPTGGGKSLCFQIPGLALEGTVIVISPLISLMKDQVDTLNRKGIPSTYINSSLSVDDTTQRFESLKNGEWKFVYVAPERLLTKKFVEICQKVTIPLIAIDEAHCISQWGHDFRPEYLQIHEFVKQLPIRPAVGAFTATATPKVIRDITTSLHLKNHQLFSRSFRRTNLTLNVITCSTLFEKHFYLLYLLKLFAGQSGVIYCLTRRATEDLVDLIKSLVPTLKIAAYHGGLSTDQRSVIQDSFLKNAIDVIVATNAFGMGVDKPNVRFVIHYHLPTSLEHYYQEAGRAGRDQQPAECFVLYRPEDLSLTTELALGNASVTKTSKSQQKHLQTQLKWMKNYAESQTCRTVVILKYFGEILSEKNCQKCDRCLPLSLLPTPDERAQYQKLLALRISLAKKHRLNPTHILTKQQAHWLVLLKPITIADFLRIPGLGRGWAHNWSQEFAPLFTEL